MYAYAYAFFFLKKLTIRHDHGCDGALFCEIISEDASSCGEYRKCQLCERGKTEGF